MGDPKRIQLKRAKGWRKPEGAVVVARPSRWGNPYKVGDTVVAFVLGDTSTVVHLEVDHAMAVALYRGWVERRQAEPDIRAHLHGHDLCCWCPLVSRGSYVPCHADVLLSIANGIPMDEVIRENTRRAAREALR